MTTTAIVNIGTLVSGDCRKGLLDADTILIQDGKIARIGKSRKTDISGADHLVDMKEMVVAPGLIDAHTHPVIGDWHPRQNVLGWMESAFHGGVTTIVSMGSGMVQGRPTDAAGVKSLAILGAKVGRNHHPGGGLKFQGGAIILEKGLKKSDFEEMAAEGVRVVAEVGAAGLHELEEIREYLDWAREVGMVIPVHFGGRSVPGSACIYAEEAAAFHPDVVVHINGGPTSAPAEEVDRLIDGTSAYLEVIYTGNFKTMYDFVLRMKERDLLDRVLIGTDSPVGAGVVPLGMLRTVLFVSSLCGVPAETAWAMASGSVADAYRLNTGKVEVGREADLLAMDAPWDCTASDALAAIEFGDIPAVTMVMVDGEVITHRARNTTLTDRRIKVNGKEISFTTREGILFSSGAG